MTSISYAPDTGFAVDRWLGSTVEAAYQRLPEPFFARIGPERVGTHPTLIHWSAGAAALIDLDPAAFEAPDWTAVLAGHRPIPGASPIAMAYAGHQFGQWVPQLGDGRAILIAQLRNARGQLWDVQLKGAGRTPFSRFGDGRAVLRSCLREYLASEAMAALGIPTTRALAVVATGEAVVRERVEPGAVMTRLAESHVRFGHFEYFAHQGRPELVKALADHVIGEHWPELVDLDARYARWYADIVARTADLVAAWQAIGFAHGVMNTDNMSILGLTIDYGPYGFLDDFDPSLICNHSDYTGRYAFDRQPAIARWNLGALAWALGSLVESDAANAALADFERRVEEGLYARLRARLGLTQARAGDAALVDTLLRMMAANRVDYTGTLRALADVVAAPATAEGAWRGRFAPAAQGAVDDWLAHYRARLELEPDPSRPARMRAANPRYIPRNWLAETAIRAIEDHGDLTPLNDISHVLRTPFDDHPGLEHYAEPPPAHLRDLEVSCSS